MDKSSPGRKAAPLMLAAAGFAMMAGLAGPAFAVDCQKDMMALMTPRQKLIAQINTFQKKKVTPQVACSAFVKLTTADKKAMEWLTTNKDWCQIPDEFMNNMKTQSAQAEKVRGQACGIAAKQAKEIARMRAMQQRQAGGPSGLPGSGVKLPNGAL